MELRNLEPSAIAISQLHGARPPERKAVGGQADVCLSNECKRRKIKCNGQTPCQRCGNLSLECLYAPNCCNNFKDSEYEAQSHKWSALNHLGNSSRCRRIYRPSRSK